MSEWSRWHPFPDPRSEGYLSTPFGPGVYELRNRMSGELVLVGESKNVARRMSSLLPSPLGSGTRNNSAKREYVRRHLGRIEYRTKACADKAGAVSEQNKLLNNSEYRFKR